MPSGTRSGNGLPDSRTSRRLIATTAPRPGRAGVVAVLLAAGFAVTLARIPIMTVDQLKPGMKGVGRSVFFGTEIEEFGVEVVDVMHQVWPRGDMILCRLSGQGLEESGVVAGMSGSPVYIDGKLIGAVAYAWTFAKQPLAGVTPAAQMLRIWDEQDRSESRGGARSGRVSVSNGLAGLSALPLPVALSGLTPALAEIVEPALREFNLSPIGMAGTASSAARDTSNLVPGAAVGVALIDGDVRLAGIGTLTCREGNRILAFGHPMFQGGSVRLPMVGGVIHSVLPSVASSFKLFSATGPVGTVNQDRLAGIGGEIGPVPEMLPVLAVVSSPSGLDTYRFRIVEQEDLAPLLAAVGLTDIVYQTEGNLEEMTLASRMTVRLSSPLSPLASRLSPLVIEHRFTGTNPAADLFRSAKNELDVLFGNRFLPAPIAAIEFDLSFDPGRSLTYLLSARPNVASVRPGDTVRVTLGLRDYRGDDSELVIAVAIPGPTPEGKLRIVIAPRDSLLVLEAMRAPAKLEAGSFADLLELFAQTGRENELVAAGFSERPGLTLAGRELPAPPPSLRSVLLNPRSDEPVMTTGESPVFRQAFRFDRVISGVAKLELEVKR
jgi:hypothetical protein